MRSNTELFSQPDSSRLKWGGIREIRYVALRLPLQLPLHQKSDDIFAID